MLRDSVKHLSTTRSLILTYPIKVEGGVEAQAKKALENLKAVVEAGGGELGKIVKTTVRPYPFSIMGARGASKERQTLSVDVGRGGL